MAKPKRSDVHVATFKKVENFLKTQKYYVYKRNIVKEIGVDYNSLNVVLGMLKIKTNKKGMIKLK